MIVHVLRHGLEYIFLVFKTLAFHNSPAQFKTKVTEHIIYYVYVYIVHVTVTNAIFISEVHLPKICFKCPIQGHFLCICSKLTTITNSHNALF